MAPAISTFLRLNFKKEPFINKKQGSFSHLLTEKVTFNVNIPEFHLRLTLKKRPGLIIRQDAANVF